MSPSFKALQKHLLWVLSNIHNYIPNPTELLLISQNINSFSRSLDTSIICGKRETSVMKNYSTILFPQKIRAKCLGCKVLINPSIQECIFCSHICKHWCILILSLQSQPFSPYLREFEVAGVHFSICSKNKENVFAYWKPRS